MRWLVLIVMGARVIDIGKLGKGKLIIILEACVPIIVAITIDFTEMLMTSLYW
jgi:hypothetical protein